MSSLYTPTASTGLEEFLGVHISIKVPERQPSGDWVGYYRTAGGGGMCEMSPRKTDLHLAGREFDMDMHTGYHRSPGTAGAHPVCRGEGEHSAAFLRKEKDNSLSRSNSCPVSPSNY